MVQTPNASRTQYSPLRTHPNPPLIREAGPVQAWGTTAGDRRCVCDPLPSIRSDSGGSLAQDQRLVLYQGFADTLAVGNLDFSVLAGPFCKGALTVQHALFPHTGPPCGQQAPV